MVIRYEANNRINEDHGRVMYWLEPSEARLLGQYFLSIRESALQRLLDGTPQVLPVDPGKKAMIEMTLYLSGLNINGERKDRKITDI